MRSAIAGYTPAETARSAAHGCCPPGAWGSRCTSPRGLDVQPLGQGGVPQPVVVGEQHPEVRAHRQGGGEVDRVQRAQVCGLEVSGTIEQRLVDSDEEDRSEQAPGLSHEVTAVSYTHLRAPETD